MGESASETLADIADGSSEQTSQKLNVQNARWVVVKADSADTDATDVDLTLLGTINAGDTMAPVNGMVDNTVDLTADEEIKVFDVGEALVETDIRVTNNNGGGNAATVNLEWQGIED